MLEAAAPAQMAQRAGASDRGSRAPDCELIDRIVAAPSVQNGNGPVSAIQVMLLPGITPSSINWLYSPSSSALGTLSASSPAQSAQVSFDCETNGTAEIIATVQARRDGRACSASAHALIECTNQPAPSAVQSPLGMCGKCTLDYCATQIAQVNDSLATVEPILSCVLGKDWPAGERASAASCANLDLLSCYCGGTPALECASAAPATLDGTCRDALLGGTGCQDSNCLQASLFESNNPTGKALLYVQCTQDFCYDYCFNP
jgi:hypothetical protein